jgi:uncharacterized protein YbcI
MADGEELAAVEKDLGQELLRLHRESYGKGASVSHAHILDDAVVCFMDGLELLPAEEFLIESGRADAVVEVRGRYQQAIELTFRDAVERATGRRVISFVSATKLDPHFIVEIFRLAPVSENMPMEPDGE